MTCVYNVLVMFIERRKRELLKMNEIKKFSYSEIKNKKHEQNGRVQKLIIELSKYNIYIYITCGVLCI